MDELRKTRLSSGMAARINNKLMALPFLLGLRPTLACALGAEMHSQRMACLDWSGLLLGASCLP